MGLLGTVVKSAVVSGTASAVRGRVSRRQSEKFADRDADIAQTRGAGFAAGVQSAQPAQPAAAPPAGDATNATLAQLKQLGELRDQGVLTDDEFAAQKAKILGT